MFKGMMAAALVTAAALATPAQAQAVYGSVDSISTALRNNDLPVEVLKPESDNPAVKSKANGITFGVLFFDCEGRKRCEAVQFYAGFSEYKKIGVEQVNAWNRDYRWGRAYIDKDGDPVIEMDLNLDQGGMESSLFDLNLETWTNLLIVFSDYLDDHDK